MAASMGGYTAVVILLLQAGASKDLQNYVSQLLFL